MARNNKQYTFIPRWNIQIQLTTTSYLHIGGDEDTDRTGPSVEQKDGSKVKAEINEFIKNSNKKPYIPGSTVKGNIRQWLESNKKENDEASELFMGLLGYSVKEDDLGCGGSAEFHNGILSHPLTNGDNYPYWDGDLQTCVEASTVIDRVTGTAADGKLYSTEVVPPGVGFTLTITGAMPEKQTALLVAAVKKGFAEDCSSPITIGAGSGNGQGRLRCDSIRMECLDTAEVTSWLKKENNSMAATAMRTLSQDEIGRYIVKGNSYLRSSSSTESIMIDFNFAGPFLVNDPSRDQNQDDSNHQPLRDAEGNARLPVKSVRGAFRSQAEKIIRTLGGKCCDPVTPCPSVFSVDEVDEKLCLACRIFGATGWKSRVSIQKVEYRGTVEQVEQEPEQDFVAIDRFHGGGKDTAKFNASFSYRPKYSITMQISSALDDWAKGLLALLLRDFREGDIFLGYGKSKGYGRVDSVELSDIAFLQAQTNLDAFRQKCIDNSQAYPCKSRQAPAPVTQTDGGNNQPEAAGRNLFHNPYHFIPTPEPMTASWLPKDDFGEEMHDSHAIFRDTDEKGAPLYHGKISCTLTTETPTFVGGKHHERDNDNEAQQVDHYTENGAVAIPATTLRGVLSSLSEAASNSSMRVLDNGMMSYRQPVREGSLSAIGMVIIRDNKKYIYPLALPLLGKGEALDEDYRLMFPHSQQAPLKVYLENAYGTGAMKNFLDKQESWSLDNDKKFYLPVAAFGFNRDHTIVGEHLEQLKISKKGNLILGIRLEGNPLPVPKEEAHPGDVPGILRIFGKQGRGDEVPGNKKHELFIPVPDEFAKDSRKFIESLNEEDLFGIPDEIVEEFEELADDRTRPQIKHPDGVRENQWLPYHLKGCSRNDGLTGKDEKKLRVQEGDLMYFRPFSDSRRRVAEISFSSVWRGRVRKKVHDYFPDELLPFNKNRKKISPAELLFGFIQQDKHIKSLSFAGKVIVSSASQEQNTQPALMDEVTLKVLSSPKLPSPSLYFNNGGYISKKDLNNATTVKPRGRKYYLHALPDSDDPEAVQKISSTGQNPGDSYPWISRNDEHMKQKVCIQPVRRGESFTFEMEFENCTGWELGMLLYALRPTEEYRHKIGLGKPIGLGTVRMDVESLHFINRHNRYNVGDINSERYNYSTEHDEHYFRSIFAGTMNSEIKNSIELLGNPQNVRFPVHYPQVQGADLEEKSFRWFVANDNGTNNGLSSPAYRKIEAKKASLAELTETSNTIPGLERHEWLGK